MEKMVSPNGVKANMCCASCKHLGYNYNVYSHNIKRWCKKLDRPVLRNGNKCGYYVMAEFFQKRGYKPITK